MILRVSLTLVLYIATLLVGCKKKPEITVADFPANITTYTNNITYQKGNIVVHNGKIYQATTTVRRIAPSTFTVANNNQVFNPWVLSSEAYAKSVIDASFDSVKLWNSRDVYTVDDIVKTEDGTYYKAMWYNVNKIPTDQTGLPNPDMTWITIKEEYATNMNFIKGHNLKLTDLNSSNAININASNNIALPVPLEGSPAVQGAVDPNAKPTTVLSEAVALKYKWSYDKVYVENSVCVYGSQYFRAKWWNTGEVPRNSIKADEVWDTPWQRISSDLFRQLYSDTIPKIEEPATNVIYVDPSQEFPSSRDGYIKNWNWGSITATGSEPLPATDDPAFENIYMGKVKKAFADSSLVSGADITLENGTATVAKVDAVLNQDKWDELFPNKISYYSYSDFTTAVNMLNNYAYLVVTHKFQNTEYKKVFVLHKPTANIRLISQSDYFHAGGTLANVYPATYKVINFARFMNEVKLNDNIRVLSGFLAHAGYQSSSYWVGSINRKSFNQACFSITYNDNFTNTYYKTNEASVTNKLNDKIAFSMSINEDSLYKGSTAENFVNYSREFPAKRGVSYHGRGPFLIKGSSKYALLSGIIFGKSSILLNNPEILLNDTTPPAGSFYTTLITGGTLGFLTGLMSFMMDKDNIPSPNDVLILNDDYGVYNEANVKIKKQENRGQAGFGWSANIINGVEVANKSYANERDDNYSPSLGIRVLHYRLFSLLFGVTIDSTEKLDTIGYFPY